MTAQTDTSRPTRLCDSCGQVDDHPRHVHALGPGATPTSPEVAARALAAAQGEEQTASIIRQVQDTTTQVKHLDCCAQDGCPDGSCSIIHEATSAPSDEPLRGQELVQHLTSGEVDSVGNDLNAQRTTEAQVDAESQANNQSEGDR